MRTPDKTLPAPARARGNRCRPIGSINQTAETTIAKPLTVHSNPRVASAELIADLSRSTRSPALVVAQPRTRNAAAIIRSASTLAAIRTSLVIDVWLLSYSNPSHSSYAVELCCRSRISQEPREVVNHQQRPGKRNDFVYETNVGGKPGNQRLRDHSKPASQGHFKTGQR